MPLLFHIATSDQNRELEAILHMFLDLQSARDNVHNTVMFLTIYAAITRFSSCAFCICVIYQ